MLTVVIPVYNEASCIDALSERLRNLRSELDEEVEVIFADDHSTDDTPRLLEAICREDEAFRMIRLSRNSGSHIAIVAGLAHCRGDGTL